MYHINEPCIYSNVNVADSVEIDLLFSVLSIYNQVSRRIYKIRKDGSDKGCSICWYFYDLETALESPVNIRFGFLNWPLYFSSRILLADVKTFWKTNKWQIRHVAGISVTQCTLWGGCSVARCTSKKWRQKVASLCVDWNFMQNSAAWWSTSERDSR